MSEAEVMVSVLIALANGLTVNLVSVLLKILSAMVFFTFKRSCSLIETRWALLSLGATSVLRKAASYGRMDWISICAMCSVI